jgi:hypothetical protein
MARDSVIGACDYWVPGRHPTKGRAWDQRCTVSRLALRPGNHVGEYDQSRLKITPPSQPVTSARAAQISP